MDVLRDDTERTVDAEATSGTLARRLRLELLEHALTDAVAELATREPSDLILALELGDPAQRVHRVPMPLKERVRQFGVAVPLFGEILTSHRFVLDEVAPRWIPVVECLPRLIVTTEREPARGYLIANETATGAECAAHWSGSRKLP